MPIGLPPDELTARWNETLKSLNCKLAEPQLPRGFDATAYKKDIASIRVPEADPSKYSTYNAYLDMAAAAIMLVSTNNTRIEEQLRAAGIDIS